MIYLKESNKMIHVATLSSRSNQDRFLLVTILPTMFVNSCSSGVARFGAF